MSPAKKQSLDDTSTCPWCSATVPAEVAQCPSCGAALRDVVDEDIAGVTQVDLAATSRLARLKPPGRIAVWLGAERTTDNPDLTGSIEPPSEEVRKEMLRLELAAIDAEIEAKTTLAEAQRNLPPDDGTPIGNNEPLADAAPPAAAAAPTDPAPPAEDGAVDADAPVAADGSDRDGASKGSPD